MLKRKKPLVLINSAANKSAKSNDLPKSGAGAAISSKRSFNCLYRKPQGSKKHKSWDGDGKIVVDEIEGTWRLYSDEGKELGVKQLRGEVVTDDQISGASLMVIAGKECELTSEIPAASGLAKFAPPLPASQSKSKLSQVASSKPKTTPPDAIADAASSRQPNYYPVYYRKPQFKMHKSWDGDGFLKICPSEKCWALLDNNGKELGRAVKLDAALCILPALGSEFRLAGKDVELASCDTISEINFVHSISRNSASNSATLQLATSQPTTTSDQHRPFKPVISRPFTSAAKLIPKFDPSKEGALVMPQLPQDLVQVVVDPFISCKLKDFQREGVVFLYKCLMGHQVQEGDTSIPTGCILADDMGLGKSLQTITLLWSLLKQNPKGRNPVARRVLVVAPASLLTNWVKEFKKWLGDTRIKSLVVKNDFSSSDFLQFHQVLIINYEKVQKFSKELSNNNYDVIVCDEGHRLKNSANQAFQVLSELPARKRIILSGTPVQNNLLEFYQMMNFCNPGLLGTLANFKKRFANPINESRVGEGDDLQKTGAKKMEELLSIVSPYLLRRSGKENANFLPPKHEFIVFNKLSPSQADLYQAEVDNTSSTDILSKINRLRTICNNIECVSIMQSSKLAAITELLKEIKSLDERVVLVSHWTKNLDVFEAFLNSSDLQYRRLDGSVQAGKRQALVDDFNNHANIFCFLLSSKAGGAGLNLIGASRLIMVDIDWNPAHDHQAYVVLFIAVYHHLL